MGGVCLSACWEGSTPLGRKHPPRKEAPPHGKEAPPHGKEAPSRKEAPPPPSRPQHTVNERPVRILLECILIHIMFKRVCRYTDFNSCMHFFENFSGKLPMLTVGASSFRPSRNCMELSWADPGFFQNQNQREAPTCHSAKFS